MPLTITRPNLTTRLLLFALTVLLGFSNLAYAQRSELAGVRHAGPGAADDSNATFAIGMSLDGNATFVTSARVSDAVSITGLLRPEPIHVGQTADIFVVDRFNITTFSMRLPDGSYVPWNGNVAALVPYREDQMLTSEVLVELYSGMLGNAGDHRMFVGYLPADGILRYNLIGHRVDITAQSAREQAVEFFPDRISTNIVQVPSSCIFCHVSGGIAAGRALHTFVPTNDPDHLSRNFAQFENLVNARGRQYVLGKVVGTGHEGGAVLSINSQEYRDLDTFLQLLEQL